MRRILAITAMAAAVLIGAACQPTEPAMTISAKPDKNPLAYTTSYVRGKVTPSTATAKVVLQRTVGGKWVDWQSCPATGCDGATPPKIPRANVDPATGAYAIAYPVQWCGKILHLRVRSNGGSTTSPGFYTQATPGEGC